MKQTNEELESRQGVSLYIQSISGSPHGSKLFSLCQAPKSQLIQSKFQVFPVSISHRSFRPWASESLTPSFAACTPDR